VTEKTNEFQLLIARLFAQNSPSGPVIPIAEQLNWRFNRLLPLLGWPGIVAIGLLVMCVPFYFSTLRPLQASFDTLQLSAISNRAQMPYAPVVDHSLDMPSEQLVKFYKFFPSEKTSPQWFELMVDIANKKGLALNHGEYAVVRDTVGQLRRFKITLPVQGTYPQIRQYLTALIEAVPSMSLENVQFERKDITDTDLQARIKLVLYLRQAS
jgi:hypothetical protein